MAITAPFTGTPNGSTLAQAELNGSMARGLFHPRRRCSFRVLLCQQAGLHSSDAPVLPTKQPRGQRIDGRDDVCIF